MFTEPTRPLAGFIERTLYHQTFLLAQLIHVRSTSYKKHYCTPFSIFNTHLGTLSAEGAGGPSERAWIQGQPCLLSRSARPLFSPSLFLTQLARLTSLAIQYLLSSWSDIVQLVHRARASKCSIYTKMKVKTPHY